MKNQDQKTTIQVKGKKVIETHTRELREYEFHCTGCNTIHKMSPYAIAQRSMGVELVFTCECGNKIDL